MISRNAVTTPWSQRAAAVLLLPLTSACVSLPPAPETELPVPAQYSSPITLTTTDTADQPWWQGFSDPVLNDLIDRALSQNLDIAIALANLEQSRQLNRAADSDLLPRFDAFVQGEVRGILQRDNASNTRGDTTLSAGGEFSYEVSLAGREKLAQQAAQARFRAAALTVADVRRLTAAAVANQYIALRQAETRLALLEETLQLQQQTLQLVSARVAAGLTARLDADRSKAELARSEAQRPLLVARRNNAEHALAVLLGAVPGSLTVEPAKESSGQFAGGPPIQLPAEVLQQRPDVRAAEQAFLAAAAEVGVERADLYPSLRLPGSLPLLSATASGGFDSLIATLAATLDIPLLDGGRRKAEINAQQAVAEAALLSLRQRWLTALQEIENALQQLQALHQQREQLAVAVAAEQSAYQQVNALYREGLNNFIDVLDTQRSLISSRETLVDAEARYAGAIVALYTALGGDGVVLD